MGVVFWHWPVSLAGSTVHYHYQKIKDKLLVLDRAAASWTVSPAPKRRHKEIS
jgi:hypothetical protein